MSDDTAYGGFLDALADTPPKDGQYTRRQYMIRKLVRAGQGQYNATVAVQYVAANHKDWDMDEKHTWEEWEEALQRGKATKAE